ncbi:MAG: hypothetical protein KA408_07670 [Flavobacteriales bacterium]|nr:hypothetical protein [Flavobacteriales bacterium]
MVTTNLSQLVGIFNSFGSVYVHDHLDTIELEIQKPVDIGMVDDLICDALFVDPLDRMESKRCWTIRLAKRDDLRSAGELLIDEQPKSFNYLVQAA